MFDHVTADLHFDHPNILIHCERPFKDVDEMNESMVERWNERVGKRDHTAVIGDFAFKRHAHWMHRLNGKITLIAGNHDKMPTVVANNFTQTIGGDRYPGILEYRVANQPVVLCHYPLYSWRWSSHGAWMLHGHSHGRVRHPEYILALDVGVDLWGYAPVPWDVIVTLMLVKTEAKAAHDSIADRRPIEYWKDVIVDQYRDNMTAWDNTPGSNNSTPHDPRDK